MNKILIIGFLITNINSQLLEIYQVGDTINTFTDDFPKKIISGDIFNGYNRSKFIDKKTFKSNNYVLSYQSCVLFESLSMYTYPTVYVNGQTSTDIQIILFEYIDFLRDKNSRINDNYINDKTFSYGIVKLCKVTETEDLNIELLDEKYFPKIDQGIDHLAFRNKTGIYRLKQDNESYYVSSISTGTCLTQIYIQDKLICMENNINKSVNINDSFFKLSIYKSQLKTVYNDHEFEDLINAYYFNNNIDYSLYKFSDLEWFHQDNILKILPRDSVVVIKLNSLPEVPRPIKSQNKKMLLKTFDKNVEDLSPGDLLNFYELFAQKSTRVIVKNLSFNVVNDNTRISHVSYKYSKCNKFNKNATPHIITQEINVFEEQIKRQNYGVDSSYLNDRMICFKITICTDIRNQKLNFPWNVIKLNQRAKDEFKEYIFENDNIMVIYSESNEIHFVRRTGRGNCLFQALIYPFESFNHLNNSTLKDPPIYTGKILSATKNHTLEKWVENLCDDDLRDIINNKNNKTSISKIISEMDKSNHSLINLYIDELY